MLVQKSKLTAKVKLMDYLAKRDLSELELRQKLAKNFDPKEIDEAIDFAYESNWMPPAQELAERVAQQLHEKGKGYLYIQQYLTGKGLPGVDKDDSLEYKKSLDLLASRMSGETDKTRIARFLENRGYEADTISKVIYTDLSKSNA